MKKTMCLLSAMVVMVSVQMIQAKSFNGSVKNMKVGSTSESKIDGKPKISQKQNVQKRTVAEVSEVAKLSHLLNKLNLITVKTIQANLKANRYNSFGSDVDCEKDLFNAYSIQKIDGDQDQLTFSGKISCVIKATTGVAIVYFSGKLIDGWVEEFNQSYLVTHVDGE